MKFKWKHDRWIRSKQGHTSSLHLVLINTVKHCIWFPCFNWNGRGPGHICQIILKKFRGWFMISLAGYVAQWPNRFRHVHPRIHIWSKLYFWKSMSHIWVQFLRNTHLAENDGTDTSTLWCSVQNSPQLHTVKADIAKFVSLGLCLLAHSSGLAGLTLTSYGHVTRSRPRTDVTSPL